MSTLRATYSSPADGTSAFTRDLPAVSASPSSDEKTAYLSALRKSVSELQTDVNAHVTQKMEAEKTASGTDDSKEAAMEATYGEEQVDEE